jgi:hypothetical protein
MPILAMIDDQCTLPCIIAAGAVRPMQVMAEIFKEVLGKARTRYGPMLTEFPEVDLETLAALPSPLDLRGRILIKDKKSTVGDPTSSSSSLCVNNIARVLGVRCAKWHNRL